MNKVDEAATDLEKESRVKSDKQNACEIMNTNANEGNTNKEKSGDRGVVDESSTDQTLNSNAEQQNTSETGEAGADKVKI